MKFVFILLMLYTADSFSKGRLVNADFKSLAEIQAVSGTALDLLNDTKVYVSSNGINKQLSQAIVDGDKREMSKFEGFPYRVKVV